MNKRNQIGDRELGHYWESQFAEILPLFGLSGSKASLFDADLEIWHLNGIVFKAQVRHKEPWRWGDIGLCYGYERYRLDKDLAYIKSGYLYIYVVHDYSHFGRDSKTNRIEDWYAQFLDLLAEQIDKECSGYTYYGEEYLKLPICYWKLPRFNPLSQILTEVNHKFQDIEYEVPF